MGSLMSTRLRVGGALLLCFLGCSSSHMTQGSPDSGMDASSPDGGGGFPAGSLTRATMTSTVGVLLDEFPMAQRDAVAAALLKEPDSFWQARAKRQAAFTGYRLVFRKQYYSQKKDGLPIAPDSNWQIAISGKAARKTVTGHDLVTVDYSLTAMLVTAADSPASSEPALAKVGGTWDEPFVFPIDPELVLQRTGYACLDEAEFPPNSIDSEEVDSMYDQECGVEKSPSEMGCHQTLPLPTMSCVQALDAKVGKVSTKLHFERLAYDRATADKYRIGPLTTPEGADLTGIPEQFGPSRVIYRYIDASSCTLVEKCVGGTGWRRLLQFTGSDKNVGGKTLEIGAIDYFHSGSVASQLIAHGVYEWSACHHHYHFMHYGTFSFDGTDYAKRGFCLQATNRFTNNEYGSLTNPYADCGFQGIGAGWGDEYRAGLECQWLDVTDIDTSSAPVSGTRQYVSNPDGFLCEGTLQKTPSGMLEFTPTSFKTATGKPVDKPVCDYVPNWSANNTDTTPDTVPVDGDGYVTAPCIANQIGPLRNCQLAKAPSASYRLTCTPGATATLSCNVPAKSANQVVRACDYSEKLKTGNPCTYQASLGNALVVDGTTTQLKITCPGKLDADEPGGSISVYSGPAYNGDPAADVTCTLK